MNIGEESEPVEYPIPVSPRKEPVHEPSPATEPAQVPEKVGARSRVHGWRVTVDSPAGPDATDPDAAVWAYLDGDV